MYQAQYVLVWLHSIFNTIIFFINNFTKPLPRWLLTASLLEDTAKAVCYSFQTLSIPLKYKLQHMLQKYFKGVFL